LYIQLSARVKSILQAFPRRPFYARVGPGKRVFERFERRGTIGRVLRYFLENGFRIGVRTRARRNLAHPEAALAVSEARRGEVGRMALA
jgi:hypothetical protein